MSATSAVDRAGGTSFRAVAASVGVLATAVLPSFLAASLAVEIRDSFPLSKATLGAAVATSYGVATLLSSPCGRLVERIGYSASVWLASALAAASMLGIAIVAHSAEVLWAFLTLAGLANAVATPVGPALLGRDVDPRRLGIGLGLQQAGVPVGALLAGLALPGLAVPFGWRTAFAVVGVLALLLPFVIRVDPDSGSRAAYAGDLGRVRPLVLLAVATGLTTGAACGLVSFLVIYTVDVGLSAGEAGTLLAASSLAAGTARIVLGWLLDRGGDGLRWTAMMLVVGAAGFAVLLFDMPATAVVGALIGAGAGWGWPPLMMYAIVRARPHAPAQAIGIWATGVYAGAGVGPLVVGFIAEELSFAAAWGLGAVMFAAGAALVVAAARDFAAERAAAAA